jgi:hypothetical protein
MTATTTANPVAKRLVALVAAALLVLSLGAVPAQAQTQEGLVNVNVSGVLVQLPIAVAANVCDVAVNVLAEQLREGDVVCDATTDSDAVFENDNGDAPQQEGLVNVNVSDLTIQVPVAVAANICDVAVNVLARQVRTGDATCTAPADADAGA